MLVRSCCYEKIGLYDPRYAQLPDFDMWVRLCMKYEIHLMQQKLIKFRSRKGGNTSVYTPENQGRGTWEYSKILGHYLAIDKVEFLLKVFPELIKIENHLQKKLIKYYMALLALKVVNISHKVFAIDVLYSLLANAGISKKLTSKFSYLDFVELTKSRDPLNVASLMKAYKELDLKRGLNN